MARRRRSRRPKAGSARSSARPISPRPRSRPRRAPFRCSTASAISPARRSPGLDEEVRARYRTARHPQRAAHLGRADRHDLAVRRQCLVGDRAGVQLPPHAQRADARRHAPRRGGHRLRLPPVPPAQGRARAAARLFRRRAGADARRPCRHAGGGAEAHRQLDLEDDQRPGRDPVRALQGRLSAGLRARLQRLHDLPPERGDRRGARGEGRGAGWRTATAARQPELPLPPPAPALRQSLPTSSRPAASST